MKMEQTLQQKIKEIKQRAAPINYSTVSVNEIGELQTRESSLDNRVVEGYGCMWNKPNDYGEIFIRGAFAKSINERGPGKNANYEIKFLYQHNQGDPLSLFEELREDDIGLYFRTKPLDDVPNAERVIKQLRSGTLNNFSVGFDYIWDQVEYDEKQDAIIVKEAKLFEISVVGIPADMNTYAIRSKENIELLHDDTEDFIMSLPRAKQLEARQIFARHKTLLNVEPHEQRNNALNTEKPLTPAIDYNYLLNKLNF
jgi:HK97 family phage prohead protease